MADYDAIIDTEIDPDQPVTTSLMYRLRDNPLAIAEGAAGAPQIQEAAYADGSVGQAAIASGGVGQGELKTSSGEVSGAGSRILPGGAYGFYPRVRKTSGAAGNVDAQIASGIADESFATRIFLSTSGASNPFAQQTYVQSSPPYDHGDGIIQGYVYALIESGAVIGTYMAEDPPWYGNTKRAPKEQFVRDGKVYGRFHKPACCLGDLKAGKISLAEFKEQWTCKTVEEEITPANKLHGMEDLPQPFSPETGQTVVLLDPMDELTGRMIAMMQAGESVPDLFAEDYLRIDNTALNRKGPPTVPIHAAKWRP